MGSGCAGHLAPSNGSTGIGDAQPPRRLFTGPLGHVVISLLQV